MSNLPLQPRATDAVLGGNTLPPVDAVVLGGLEGVKRRLESESIEVRIAAVKDAVNYGAEGLKLLANIIKNQSGAVQWAAYDLVWEKANEDQKKTLKKYSPYGEFETVTVDAFGREIKRTRRQAIASIENLGKQTILETIGLPGGTFLMGSPDTEKGRYDCESPQHEVTVAPFLMSKFPITQAQWRAVAALPKVKILMLPNPSEFKGDNLPVQGISWQDAVEFCARLSQKTGRSYRLPSEAEWEYAARAGTNAPFQCGETITPDLANYYSKSTYACEPEGMYRGKTTPVGSFPPNAFGLCDMHGNVWEWCADAWHKNYQGAPSTGSVWEGESNACRVLRGGCWLNSPKVCRAAHRAQDSRDRSRWLYGFRVALSPA